LARVKIVKNGCGGIQLIAQHKRQISRKYGFIHGAAVPLPRGLFCRHASEQYLTSAQFLAHDLRHTIGRPQTAQGLLGRACLLPLKPVGREDMIKSGAY
jgi:hypothetical protein